MAQAMISKRVLSYPSQFFPKLSHIGRQIDRDGGPYVGHVQALYHGMQMT